MNSSYEDTLNIKVRLDSQAVHSDLIRIKQETAAAIGSAFGSVGETISAGMLGATSLGRDVSGMLGGVLTSVRASADPRAQGGLYSAWSGTFPSTTTPRSYDVEEWGKLHRNAVIGNAADLATRVSLAAPGAMADWMVGWPIGAAAGSATGAAVGGTIGGMFGPAGAVIGSGVGYLGGMLAGGEYGGRLARAPVDYIMGGAQQRYAVGATLKAQGSRIGLNKSDFVGVQTGIEALAESERFGSGEITDLVRTGFETGVFGQVSSASEFNSRFKSVLRGATEIARTLKMDMDDAVRTIAQAQELGFGSIGGAVSAIRSAKALSKATGITSAEGLALMEAGARATVGTGFTAEYGSQAAMANYQAVTMGLRDKSLGQETVSALGGRVGAAMTLAQHQMAYLESPMGRATLLAQYDVNTGQLDPSKTSFEPGIAFNRAVQTIHGADNPIQAMLEFAGRRDELKSQMSPEELALSQVMTWQTMARHINPRGPVTNDMIIGAASMMGVNPTAARAMLNTATDVDAIARRQQQLRDVLAEGGSRGMAPQPTLWGRFKTYAAEVTGARSARNFITRGFEDIRSFGRWAEPTVSGFAGNIMTRLERAAGIGPGGVNYAAGDQQEVIRAALVDKDMPFFRDAFDAAIDEKTLNSQDEEMGKVVDVFLQKLGRSPSNTGVLGAADRLKQNISDVAHEAYLGARRYIKEQLTGVPYTFDYVDKDRMTGDVLATINAGLDIVDKSWTPSANERQFVASNMDDFLFLAKGGTGKRAEAATRRMTDALKYSEVENKDRMGAIIKGLGSGQRTRGAAILEAVVNQEKRAAAHTAIAYGAGSMLQRTAFGRKQFAAVDASRGIADQTRGALLGVLGLTGDSSASSAAIQDLKINNPYVDRLRQDFQAIQSLMGDKDSISLSAIESGAYNLFNKADLKVIAGFDGQQGEAADVLTREELLRGAELKLYQASGARTGGQTSSDFQQLEAMNKVAGTLSRLEKVMISLNGLISARMPAGSSGSTGTGSAGGSSSVALPGPF